MNVGNVHNNPYGIIYQTPNGKVFECTNVDGNYWYWVISKYTLWYPKCFRTDRRKAIDWLINGGRNLYCSAPKEVMENREKAIEWVNNGGRIIYG